MGKVIKFLLFILRVFAPWLRGKPNNTKLNKLRQEADDLTNEQAEVLDTKPFDYERYRSIDAELVRLNKKIARIQTG